MTSHAIGYQALPLLTFRHHLSLGTRLEVSHMHRRFQRQELTQPLMVTAEGSAERCIALMCILREALDELS